MIAEVVGQVSELMESVRDAFDGLGAAAAGTTEQGSVQMLVSSTSGGGGGGGGGTGAIVSSGLTSADAVAAVGAVLAATSDAGAATRTGMRTSWVAPSRRMLSFAEARTEAPSVPVPTLSVTFFNPMTCPDSMVEGVFVLDDFCSISA